MSGSRTPSSFSYRSEAKGPKNPPVGLAQVSRVSTPCLDDPRADVGPDETIYVYFDIDVSGMGTQDLAALTRPMSRVCLRPQDGTASGPIVIRLSHTLGPDLVRCEAAVRHSDAGDLCPGTFPLHVWKG